MKQWRRDVIRRRGNVILHEIMMACKCGVEGYKLPFFYDHYLSVEKLGYPMREVETLNPREALKDLDTYMGTSLTIEDPNLYQDPEPGTGVAPLATQIPLDNR